MNKDKLEGFLIGIGSGIAFAAFVRAHEQSRKKPVGTASGDSPAEESAPVGAPAQPPNQSVQASHA